MANFGLSGSQEVEYRVMNFSGGLNTTTPSELLNDNEASDIRNIRFDERGIIKKRKGLVIDNNIPKEITKEAVVYKLAHMYHYVSYQNGKMELILFYTDGEKGYFKGLQNGDFYDIDIKTAEADPTVLFYTYRETLLGNNGLSPMEAIPAFFTMNDVMYLTSIHQGYKYEGRKNTGTTSETMLVANGIPKAQMAVVKDNRAFYAGDLQYPDYLYFSQLADPESVSSTVSDKLYGGSTTVTGGGIVRMPSEDVVITGLAVFNNAIIIFKPDSVYSLTGVDPNTDWQLNELNVSNGCIAYRTVVKGNNLVYWLSKNGVYFLSSPQQQVIEAKPLSYPINDQLKLSGIDYYEAQAFFHENNYYLTIDPKNKKETFVFNEATPTWTKYDIAPKSASYNPKDRTLYFIENDHVSSLTGELKDEVSPGVFSGIDAFYQTATLRLDAPQVTKRFQWMMVFFKPNPVEDSTVKVKYEIDYRDSERTVDSSYFSFVWGVSKWGQANWGQARDEISKMVRFGGQGKSIRFTFSNDGVDEDLEIHGFVVGYKPKRRRR